MTRQQVVAEAGIAAPRSGELGVVQQLHHSHAAQSEQADEQGSSGGREKGRSARSGEGVTGTPRDCGSVERCGEEDMAHRSGAILLYIAHSWLRRSERADGW